MEQTTTPCTLRQYVALVTQVGLTSFGGGLSGWMLRLVVHQRRWMSESEFLTGVGLCQVFPGINVLNLSIWLGYRMHGTRGAIAGALAMILPPAFVIILIYEAFVGLSHIPPVGAALDGVAAAAIGLSASMGIRAARRSLRPPATHRVIDPAPAALLALTFVAIGLAQLPLIPVVLVLVPISVLLAWRRTAKAGPA